MAEAHLHISTSRPLSSQERRAILSALAINESFFGYPLPHLLLVVCHSNAEWKRATKYYHFEFARGVVLRDGTVVVKSPKLAQRSITQWKKIVAHEINHTYWAELSPRGRDLWSPIWLLEGLACLVAKNDVVMSVREMRKAVRSLPVDSLLPYRYRASLFPDHQAVRIYYSLWCHFLVWLTSKKPQGVRQLLRQRRNLRSQAMFERQFKGIWSSSPSKLLSVYLGIPL